MAVKNTWTRGEKVYPADLNAMATLLNQLEQAIADLGALSDPGIIGLELVQADTETQALDALGAGTVGKAVFTAATEAQGRAAFDLDEVDNTSDEDKPVSAAQAEAIGAVANGAIPKALVDAKGDLLVGTADNTVGRLAKGSPGQILTPDPSQATGLRWVTQTSGANNYLIWVGDLDTGIGTWPARPDNDLPTIWIGGVSPGNLPPEHEAGDFWQPARGDWIDLGATLEAMQTLTLAAGKIPFFSSSSAAGVLDLIKTVRNTPSDNAVWSEAACKNYIDRLVTQTAKTGAYNVVGTDQGTVLEYNSTSAATFTVTNDFAAGNVVGFRSVNTGILTIAAGSGVTLNSFNGAFKLAGQWAEASINFRTNSHAILSGQLVT